jgi:hypothetical protein
MTFMHASQMAWRCRGQCAILFVAAAPPWAAGSIEGGQRVIGWRPRRQGRFGKARIFDSFRTRLHSNLHFDNWETVN